MIILKPEKKRKKKSKFQMKKTKFILFLFYIKDSLKNITILFTKFTLKKKKTLNRIEKENKEKIEREKSSLLRKLKEQKKKFIIKQS